MLRLTYRDLFIYQRRNLIIFPLFGVYFIAIFLFMAEQQYPFVALAIALSLYGILMVSQTAFSYDESTRFNKFVRALPVSATRIVFSRYLSCIFFSLLGFAWMLILGYAARWLSGVLGKGYIDMTITVESIIIWLSAVALFPALLIPPLYKFGYMKSRYVLMLLIIVLIAGLPSLLSGAVPQVLDVLNMLSSNFILLFAAAAVLFCASVFLSARILRNKEI